jgi:putative ABC transport system substrate-binding protein
MRRRDFITLLGGAAVAPSTLLPRAARAQPAMPVIGFLNPTSADGYSERLRGFRQGLKETGYVEGENVAIEYRWAEGQLDRLPALAADLINRRVAVMAALGSADPGLAAKAATTTIPIVFLVGEDPVRLGLVPSLARMDSNLTGVNLFNNEITAKRLNLLLGLVPSAVRVAALLNLVNLAAGDNAEKEIEDAARALGLRLQLHKAGTIREIDAAFATFAGERPDALLVSGGSLFNSRRAQIVHLASHYRLPTTYASRAYPDIGGLMSYGTDVTVSYRQAGAYAGRILKGAKPADLPVVQASKFELVINAQTARMLGLTVPPSLLSIADEVIE